MPYDIVVELWSDGAKKQRWIQLPPGEKIDVADLDNWQFPKGTKLWKQFTVSIGGVTSQPANITVQ